MKKLKLKNSITFTVIVLDDEKEFVTGEHVDRYNIEDVEEFQNYVEERYDKESEVKVCAAYYVVVASGESTNATDEEAAYIANHLEDVLEDAICLKNSMFFFQIID